jgi:hypothetical protein
VKIRRDIASLHARTSKAWSVIVKLITGAGSVDRTARSRYQCSAARRSVTNTRVSADRREGRRFAPGDSHRARRRRHGMGLAVDKLSWNPTASDAGR